MTSTNQSSIPNNYTDKTMLKYGERVREYLIQKRKWMFIWEEVVKTESLGHEIHIATPNKIDVIYLNGKRIEL